MFGMVPNKKEDATETLRNQPCIAAVAVTYDRCAQLDRCRESLLHQDRPLDEMLVIDNESTDETVYLLGKKSHGKLSYVRLE